MSILKYPNFLCKQISSHLARFWWASSNRDNGIHWSKWKNLTFSKNHGGLGFKDFKIMNQALLTKQAWRLANKPNTLWAQIIKGKYFHDREFWKVEKKARCSWAWESILKERELLLTHEYWQIGDGKSVRIF